MAAYVKWFDAIGRDSEADVGPKNASLGEMTQKLLEQGIHVPSGFAVTVAAYYDFMRHDDLGVRIDQAMDTLDIEDLSKLSQVGQSIRQWIAQSPLPEALVDEVSKAYHTLSELNHQAPVAVRSSGLFEDLADASFAGQQDTFLNLQGIDNVLSGIKAVYASLFSDRAINYRHHHHIDHDDVAMSVGIQTLVNCSDGISGVLFTLDPDTGFDQVIFISATYGFGDAVVKGRVSPDEFYVYKPTLTSERGAILRRSLGRKHIRCVVTDQPTLGNSIIDIGVSNQQQQRFALTDETLIKLSRLALTIEQHYQSPVNIEWAMVDEQSPVQILQARPETVHHKTQSVMERYLLREHGEVLIEGKAVGRQIASGCVRHIKELREENLVRDGDIIVTDMVDPDWEPLLSRAGAIVTNRGGRTSHAAIIARELGIPAVVGCVDATELLAEDELVTVSCAQGDTGHVYRGDLDFEVITNSKGNMPELASKIMVNVGNPDRAFDFQALPNDGIGLARLEFINNRMIGVHPKAILDYQQLPKELKKTIASRMAGYADPETFYIEKLVECIATLAAACYPKPVMVRLSDFKSNEYANLIGGALYEPKEENPMLGFRGAARYLSENFRACFELECRALKQVRDQMGFTNVEIIVPFVRTIEGAKAVIELLAQMGLKRGDNGLRILMMCELPANVILADQFLDHFDGFTIGANDLTQLVLGVDRDSVLVANLFNEQDPAVLALLSQVINICKKRGKYIGVSGQGPSEHKALALWLVQQGVDSLSLNPDKLMEIWFYLAQNTAKNVQKLDKK